VTDRPAHPGTGRLGLPTASALYVAAVLGTGILLLPGFAAAAAGPGSVIGVGVVLVLSIPLAGAFAALAARHPDSGGVATFVRLALGPTAARAAGYWFLFGAGMGAPVVAVLGGSYLTAVTGIDPAWVPLIGLPFLLVPIVLAVFGLRFSGRVQLVLTALLLAVVVLVVASALPHARPHPFTPLLPHGWAGVGVVISLFVWAFAGWEAVTHLAAEFRRPHRVIPLATAIAVAVVGVSYLALQVATVVVMPARSAPSTVPLLDLTARTLPGVGPAIVAAIAVIVVLGVLNAYVPAMANLAASLGRDGHLPRWFARGAEAGAVPRRGVALVAVVCLGYTAAYFLLRIDLQVLVLVQTSSLVAVYLAGMVAAVRLLPRWTPGWWMACAGVVLTAGLAVLAGWHLVAPAALALVAAAVTIARRIRLRDRSG
jgi:amino acid efflux transporter